ncbi:DUF2156 domain-containing protein [Modestobacter sp. I12A-02628]|uniref:DUF2156 domain-containing protein n=1 Tax=Goekera deserti TaxID=2497753 RepID=A0A7K3WDD5_9ACTN|nr:DUF2156 domain-containing protein [Goekera deserti]MPQ96753.1 DUF2156 domain-containing protein [Goekera deserti]NDI46933.1 DUF2156 domain-containing protein [Goekera deserti]NEL54501.1 DUF2156 domain-containing protein [Goekera deserti]
MSAAPLTTSLGRLRQTPVTAGLVVLLVAGAVADALTGRPVEQVLGTGVGPLSDGRWATLATSGFAASSPVVLVASVAVVLLLLPRVERLLGPVRALGAVLGGQVLAGLVALGGVAVLSAAGDRWAVQLADAVVVGPLPGVLAAAGLASARQSRYAARRLRLAASVVLVCLVLYSGTAGDVLRLTGFLLGVAAGALGQRRRGARPVWSAPSRREQRALVALIVAATAVGPLVAALSRTPEGPWAVVSHLFVSGRPHAGLLREVCARGGDPARCQALQARARLTGAGPALLSVLPVVLQLLLAEGLRRGRRAAWVGAVALTGVLTVVGAFVVVDVLRTPAESLPLLASPAGSLPAVAVLAPVTAPGAVLLLLVLTRTRFDVRAAPETVRRWLVAAGLGLLLVVGCYLLAGSVLTADDAAGPGIGAMLLDLPRRMLPPGYLDAVLPSAFGLQGLPRVLVGWTGVLCWAVLVGTACLLVRPAVPRGDAARARALVDRHGEGALAFMTTWTGNRWWFTPDGAAVVAFRVVGGVALTTGDPVGPPEARAAAVRGFTAWCEQHGWTACWYSVTDEVVPLLPEARTVQVAAETWLPLGELAFVGKRWQDVRTALNRATRDGVQARWLTWQEAPVALREQVVRASEDWLAGKGLPEMGFTLGGVDELADPAVRCLLALAADGRVLAVTSWLPSRRDGRPVGWTLDLMRRSPGCPPGIMEFLLATAATTFQAEGAEHVSLSGAPLALPGGARRPDALERLLEVTGRAMEPVYGFRSLLAFKAKFQPQHRPLWLVYPATADLPRIAAAVCRAYVPHLSAVQALRLGRALVRGWTARPAARPEQVATARAGR